MAQELVERPGVPKMSAQAGRLKSYRSRLLDISAELREIMTSAEVSWSTIISNIGALSGCRMGNPWPQYEKLFRWYPDEELRRIGIEPDPKGKF